MNERLHADAYVISGFEKFDRRQFRDFAQFVGSLGLDLSAVIVPPDKEPRNTIEVVDSSQPIFIDRDQLTAFAEEVSTSPGLGKKVFSALLDNLLQDLDKIPAEDRDKFATMSQIDTSVEFRNVRLKNIAYGVNESYNGTKFDDDAYVTIVDSDGVINWENFQLRKDISNGSKIRNSRHDVNPDDTPLFDVSAIYAFNQPEINGIPGLGTSGVNVLLEAHSALQEYDIEA